MIESVGMLAGRMDLRIKLIKRQPWKKVSS